MISFVLKKSNKIRNTFRSFNIPVDFCVHIHWHFLHLRQHSTQVVKHVILGFPLSLITDKALPLVTESNECTSDKGVPACEKTTRWFDKIKSFIICSETKAYIDLTLECFFVMVRAGALFLQAIAAIQAQSFTILSTLLVSVINCKILTSFRIQM